MQNTATGQYSGGPVVLRSLIMLFQELDWWLVLATVFLLVVGLDTLEGEAHLFHDKQLQFLIVGAVAAIAFWRVPYFVWTNRFVLPALYLINLILLGLVTTKFGH